MGFSPMLSEASLGPEQAILTLGSGAPAYTDLQGIPLDMPALSDLALEILPSIGIDVRGGDAAESIIGSSFHASRPEVFPAECEAFVIRVEQVLRFPGLVHGVRDVSARRLVVANATSSTPASLAVIVDLSGLFQDVIRIHTGATMADMRMLPQTLVDLQEILANIMTSNHVRRSTHVAVKIRPTTAVLGTPLTLMPTFVLLIKGSPSANASVELVQRHLGYKCYFIHKQIYQIRETIPSTPDVRLKHITKLRLGHDWDRRQYRDIDTRDRNAILEIAKPFASNITKLFF
jgi:hypothetical protein